MWALDERFDGLEIPLIVGTERKLMNYTSLPGSFCLSMIDLHVLVTPSCMYNSCSLSQSV